MLDEIERHMRENPEKLAAYAAEMLQSKEDARIKLFVDFPHPRLSPRPAGAVFGG